MKAIIFKIKNLFDFFLYHMASKKNTYQNIFVGERENNKEKNNTIILFRTKGIKKIEEIPIKKLLKNESFVGNFDQKDALKFGFIAINDIYSSTTKEKFEKQFFLIREKMLQPDSTFKHFKNESNYYPCRFSGTKECYKNGTIILYTCQYKRDVFECSINDLVEDVNLLEKFHPTFAIKVGCIFMGETLLK